MKDTKAARFFCESCDTEVVGDALYCPKCGKIFASVRCPVCEFTGNHVVFTNGCPRCGYAMNSTAAKKKAKEEKKKNKQLSMIDDYKSKKKYSDDALPAWIYLICIGLLIGILVSIFVIIT